jgi:hypothetical protein
VPIWTFVDYVEASGRNPFADWMDGEIALEAKIRINARFSQMVPKRQWPEKWVSTYEGYPGILEARITFKKVQYRPLFMRAIKVRWQLVLLSGAIEKGGKIPKSTLDAANVRREAVIRESTRVTRHQYS